ncbi:FXYD domain containing ion transport regulator 3, transcript variant X1 [Ictidomys tridecemlineatus]|nr:FXYD domain containing ion transport regulator 3, transcript variant X1 [Ictidomys tridecemlineatus]
MGRASSLPCSCCACSLASCRSVLDMQEVALRLLVLLAGLPALDANDPEDKNSPFYYDWYSLRVGGLICAGVLCAIGIIVLMSGKCKCRFSPKPSHRPGDAPPLITPGSAHNC